MTWRGVTAWHFCKVLKSGTYSVNVNLGGDPIKDSPRSGVEFIAGAVDATSCSLDDQAGGVLRTMSRQTLILILLLLFPAPV